MVWHFYIIKKIKKYYDLKKINPKNPFIFHYIGKIKP